MEHLVPRDGWRDHLVRLAADTEGNPDRVITRDMFKVLT